MNPKVLDQDTLCSVLIPNYNYEQFVSDAIRSVLRQTHEKFEVVVVDDGSNDGSREIIDQFVRSDERVRAAFQPNAGVAAALTRAFSMSRGEVVCLLDADDVFHEAKLERVVNALSGYDGMAIHKLRRVVHGEARAPLPRGALPQGDLQSDLLRGTAALTFPQATGMSFRREALASVMPIPLEFRTYADAYLQWTVPLSTRVVAINDSLADYRLHGANITGAAAIDSSLFELELQAIERLADAQRRYVKANEPAMLPLVADAHDRLMWRRYRFLLAAWIGEDSTGDRFKSYRLHDAFAAQPLDRQLLDRAVAAARPRWFARKLIAASHGGRGAFLGEIGVTRRLRKRRLAAG